ncbi:MAG: competence protein ComEC [Chloroflexi bacterium]|nr:MAG: competence protein ComEC [Chloroflexota bacterium]
MLLLFLALGALRLEINIPVWNGDDLAWYNNKGEYTITAWVSAPPDRRETFVVYQMTAVEINDQFTPDWINAINKVNGVAQVRMYSGAKWEYGDLLQFTAKLSTPSENQDFSYKEYLARQNIHTVIYYPQHLRQVGSGMGSQFRRTLINLRESAWKTIFSIFPQPESGLLAGILLGMDNDLPKSLAQAYRDTGTSHIIAISGFNMAVLASLFLWMFTRVFNRYWAVLLAAIAIFIYTIFVDGSASVIRAAVMAVIAFGGHLIGRKQSGLNALGFTAAVMCLFNPLLLWDVSFQLSFMATFGLVVFAQPLQTWAQDRLAKHLPEETAVKISSPLSEYLLFTFAAQIATLPVIVLQFGRLSISSLIANPLVIPAQPAVLVLGGITTIAGMILPMAGEALGVFVWPLLAYTNRVVQLLAKIKGGVLTIHPSFSIWILIGFILFLLLFIFHNYFKKLLGSSRLVWLCVLLLCGSVTVWSIYLHRPDGNLHVTLLRTGEDATLFLQTPGGKTVVFDPRGSVNELSAALSRDLTPWDYRLDSVLLTDRSSADELSQLSARLPVNEVLLAPAIYRATNTKFPVILPENIALDKLTSGETVEIGPGVTLTLVAENANGTALLLEHKNIKLLIPNGVDYALIKESAPESMQTLTALVLTPDDISYIPPRVWLQLNPAVILWNSPTLSPFVNSIGVDESTRVSLTSDGVEYWVQASR